MISARKLGLDVQGTSGGEELVRCPFHDDHKASAWFNPRKGLFYCAVCHLGLNLMQLAGRLKVDIELDAYAMAEMELTDFELITEESSIDLGFPHYNDYIAERGVSREVAIRYDVRWMNHPYPAAVLPITTPTGRVTGACYRYLKPTDAGTRYRIVGVTAPVWPMKLLAEAMYRDAVVICEGAWSAMKIDSFVFEMVGKHINSLALLGAKANQEIVDTTSSHRCFFLYDNDDAGRNACRIMRKLAPAQQSYVLSKSPDDMNNDELTRLMEKLGKRMGVFL